MPRNLFYTKCTVGVDPCFIDIGWNFTRNLVNIALIIGLVIIAFFTIIGNQNYSARKTLIPFITVAILVNFSRVFVGVVVDLSNIVMGVFVSTIPTLKDTAALWALSGTSLLSGASLNTSIALAGLLKIIVIIIYFIGLAFVFFLYSVIFAVRFMAIWLLTIMAPLALAAWIFPSTKKIFNMWRDQLVQWSFIGIPMLFFLWIGLLAMAQFKAMGPPEATLDASGLEGFFADILPSILLLLLLYVTFAFAMKSGAMGSSMIISAGKKLGKTVGLATGKFAGKMAWRAGRVGAREAAGVAGRRIVRPGLRKIAPHVPFVKQWQPGYVVKKYDERDPTKRQKNREKLFKQAGWHKDLQGNLIDKNGNFVRDRRGRNVTSATAWGSLSPDQQKAIERGSKSKISRVAAIALGKGRKGSGWIKEQAKRLESSPFNLLTPEEQKALLSVISLAKFIAAKKNETQKALETLNETSVDELRRTAKHPGSSESTKMAAQLLLRKKDEGFDFRLL